MNTEQQDAIVSVTASLCKRFNIPINTDRIVYHHWSDLNTGARTNGTGVTKTCPGTAFFEAIPWPIANKISFRWYRRPFRAPRRTVPPPSPPKDVRSVTANQLNIATSPVVPETRLASPPWVPLYGSAKYRTAGIKISQSKQEWVYGHYVQQVQRATVTADHLNAQRPSAQFSVVGFGTG